MRKTGLKNEIKRTIAILLLVTMLPFADFAGCLGNEVYGAALPRGTENESAAGMVSENEIEMQQSLLQEQVPQNDVQTMELAENITLEDDWNVTEEIVMTGGTLDLNGHTMTVSSNLIHSGGSIYFNGGKLIVEGDYRKQTRMQNEDGSYSYEGADSTLQMSNDEDYFLIKGDFYDSTINSYGVGLSRGCLELKGSLYQSEEAAQWSYYQNLLLLSGEEKQIIHFKENEENIAYIGKLKITNVSEEGVLIEGKHRVYDSFESDRESHIEGILYCTGYNLTAGGYYGGSVELVYGRTFNDSFEIGGDLYVSSYSDLWAEWIVGGNFYINTQVGVHDDLTVQGDVYLSDGKNSSGRLYIYKGNVTVKGNVIGKSVTGSSYTGIEIRDPKTHVLIEGDYCLSSTLEYYSFCNYGTMEVKGNIFFDHNVSFRDGATLVLSGDQEQRVHVTESSNFDYIEIQNHSEEGVCFEDYIHYEKLTTNGCHVKYCQTPVLSGYTLSEDTVIEGNVLLTGESMDLNGHTLTVKGNLIQKGIAMNVNGGKLIVEGDYSIGEPQTMWEETLTTYSTGSLKMTNEEDYVLVYGDFYTSRGCSGSTYCGRLHPYCASILSNGILEVKGDVVAKDKDSKSSGSFLCSGDHTLLLSGSEGQSVWLDSDNSGFINLKITNNSQEGVEFIGEPVAYGEIDAGRDVRTKGLLRVENINRIKDSYYPGSIATNGCTISQDLEIGGDLVIKGKLDMKRAALKVNGNVEVEENTNNAKGAMLLMQDEGAYLFVNGNFTNKSCLSKLEQGTIELKGNFTDNCNITYGNGHRILFSGNELQTIVSKASLGIVELQNPVGVFSERAFGFYKLILNGCRLVIADEDGAIGFTLSDDYVVDGDLYLVAGVMDLNGHTLTVKGDLILQEGTLNINHGCLVVEGDYRQQFKKKTETGYEYSNSEGILSMIYDDDIMKVGGDFILVPTENSQVCCEKGNLYVAGNMEIGAKDSFRLKGTVILNGKQQQVITAGNPLIFHELLIENTSAKGVAFEAEVTVEGSLSDEGYKAGGSKAVTVMDLNHLVNGRFGGSLNLTSTCTLQQDLDIRGELGLNKGTSDVQLYCGGQTVSVHSLRINQVLYVQKGKIEAAENLYKDYYGKIVMDQEEGCILVNGNVEFAYCGQKSVFNAGTMEIKGDYTDYTAEDFNIKHRMILSGSGLQTLNTSSYLGTLELDNHSEEGVYSAVTIKKKKLIYNGCRLTIGDGTGIYGFTLTEDYVVDGDLTLLDDTLDLNGHTMTVRGSLLLQEGTLKVNGGTLIVEGNLQLQSKYRRSKWEGCGCLVMENEDDLVKIGRDLIFVQEEKCNCNISKGTIELQGNLKRMDHYSSICNIGCDLILNGSQKQEINVRNLQLGNLIIKNESEEGVSLTSNITLTGELTDDGNKMSGTGKLCLKDLKQLAGGIYAGNVALSGTSTLESDIAVLGTLYVDGVLYCGKHTLKTGNLVINGKLYTDRGSVLANGDMTVGTAGMLSMKNREAYVLVNGNVSIGDSYLNLYNPHKNDLTDGVLEIKGNYMDYSYVSYGVDHKIILSGSGLQEIRVTGALGTLELQNYSEEGIYSESAVKVLKMITNGCHYNIGEGYGIYGYTLTEDYVAAGDLVLYGDTLDLNGRTMIVQGNLTLWDGELKINGGTLIVEGDLLIQRLSSYNKDSYGCLIMENENDMLKIGGDWIIQPGNPCHCKIGNGTIELQGDLIKKTSGYTGIYDIGCRLILNGNEKQTVSVSKNLQIQDLTISNRSEGGIYFASDAVITGEVEDSEGKIDGNGSIIITDIGQLKAGNFGGNVILEGNSTMENDISIDGTLQIDGVLHCGEYMLQADAIIVNGQMYTDQATIIIDNGLDIGNKGLFVMTEEEAYVLVKENLSFASTISHQGYLTNGVLEVLNNINVEKYCDGFMASDEHYTIFRRRNVADTQTVKQRVYLKSGSSIHFAKLELTKDFQAGYVNYYSSLEQMADEVIYVKAGTSIPNPVTGIISQEVTETTVTLSYEGNWDDGSLKGFMIYRNGKRIAMTANRSYKDSGLKPDETYIYMVYPYNTDRQTARTAPQLQVTTMKDTEAPKAPENLMVAVRSGSAVTLKWDKSKDNVAIGGYRLYRDGQLIYEGAANEYKDVGLEENTLYTYEVKAYDTSGNESEAGKKVDGAVYIPKILSVTPGDYEDVGGDVLNMSIRCKNGGNSVGNSLDIAYYDPENDRWIEITRPSLGQSENKSEYTISYTWDISELSIENDVDVRFTLRDADGNETEKILTYVIDRKAPAVPENVFANDDGGTVVINWDISKSADCTGYELYRVNMQTQEGALLATVGGRNSSWYRDSTVEDEITYHYYLKAHDKFGNQSPMSEIAKVTVAEDTKAPRVTDLTPKSGKIHQCVTFVVSGSDNRTIAEFDLFMRRSSEEEWQLLTTVEAQDDQGTFQWDTAGYEEGNYYIKAVARDKNGNESADLFMRRYEVDNTGIAKIRLLDTTAGSTTIQLTWEDVTEEDFGWFIVEELIDGEWVERGKITSQLGYRLEDLEPESTHTYRVTGYDLLGNPGIPSDTVTMTTLSDTTAPNIAAINPVSSFYKDAIDLSMRVKDNGGVAYGVFSYSVSGNDFVEIATVSGNGGCDETLCHKWDLSGIPEQEVTVRFEAYDTAGNHNALYEDAQIENTYIVDRHAPEKVTGVHITGNEGCISLAWDSVSDNDVAAYIIERSVEGEGIFVKIGETGSTLYYTDSHVKENVDYSYRISAKDIAGNMGEASEEVCGTVMPDEEAPVVTGISPGEEIIGSNPTLKVLAMDNAKLKEIILEYREAEETDIWHEIAVIEAAGREEYKALTWNTDGLSEGIVYEVRAKAVDAAGNESEYVTRNYLLDLTPPQAPELTVKSGSFCIEMEYSENQEEDFRCYKIYRKEYGQKDYTCIQATIQNTFTDAVPETNTTYYYKVCALDIYGNCSESNVEHSYANNVDKIAPVAELPETMFGFTGMEIAFDGTLCSDNVRINRYEWDFGDGTKQTGVRPVHSYEKAGSYNVTLTVWDGAGNKACAAGVVQVMDKTNSGSATIKVLAKDGTALGGAYVYVKTGNDKDDYVQLRTDVNGEAKVVSKAGIYEFAAYAQDYMPGDGTIRISNYESLETTITLEKGEVITGNLTVERMELDELIEKGVDLSAPENYNTYKFSVELWFAASPLPVVYDVTYSDELFYRTGSIDCVAGRGRISNGNGTLNIELLKPEEVEADDMEINGYVPTITYLQTTQSVSWLKDMYDVQLGIINNADSGYTVTEASATLNLPEGLSLAATKSGQTLTTKLPDIGGQETAFASWVVKGDKTETYDLSASFHGVLQPFEADIDAQFEAQMECEVKGGEGIVIYVSPEDAYYPGEDYYIQFKIVNESDRNFYNFSTSLGEYKAASQKQEVYIKDYETGELIAVQRATGMTYQSKAAAKCPTLPVLYDGDVIEVGVFSPGQTIYGTYCVKMGNQESDTTYFKLVNQLVTTLEGSNLGVEVVVNPVPSHIYKYVLYTDYRTRLREAKEAMEMAETYGDPIDVTTGAFLQDLGTISLTGGSNLSFDLHYNSMLAGYKGEAGYGWSHDYEQHVTEAGSSLILTLSPYSETSFIHEEAANHTVYGVLQENTIIMDDHIYEEGTYLPTSSNMEGWKMEKDSGGYRLITKEGAVYTFDKEGKMSHISTREGKGTAIARTENAMTITDDITGESIHVLYDENHMISSVTDDHGRMVNLEHIDGDLTAITGVTGESSAYLYDGSHKMTGAVNANGVNYVNNTYDDYGRVLTQREAGRPGVSRLTYTDTESGGVQVDICNQNGGSTSVVMNEKGEKIKETGSDGAFTEYLYDKYGNLLDERDAYGNTVMYQYDENQMLTAAYDTAGNVTFMDYDDAGNVTAVRTQTGEESLYTYDANNRLIRNVSP
ncbi:MAG: PKD domain-containing protein, partial [Lachnospiraceae bacterium]|nr:PKD domain-containing protein [Lachnospiraceae bacterium]